MPEDAIPNLSGYSEAELDQAFSAIAREVETSAAALETPEPSSSFASIGSAASREDSRPSAMHG